MVEVKLEINYKAKRFELRKLNGLNDNVAINQFIKKAVDGIKKAVDEHKGKLAEAKAKENHIAYLKTEIPKLFPGIKVEVEQEYYQNPYAKGYSAPSYFNSVKVVFPGTGIVWKYVTFKDGQIIVGEQIKVTPLKCDIREAIKMSGIDIISTEK